MNTTLISRSNGSHATWLLYGLAAASLALLLLAPHAAAFMGAEDGLIENISALLFLIASVIAALKGIRAASKNDKNSLSAGILFALCLLFFVFAGEEISWGQRIFNFETNEFLQANNWQGESNFHNLQTDAFNILYHYGAFLFLIAMPLFHKQVSAILDKIGMSDAKGFIAPAWLGFGMLAFIGMIDPRFVYVIEKPWAAILYLLALFLSLIIIGARLAGTHKSKSDSEVTFLVTGLLLIALGLFVSYFQAIDFSPNAISEYKEMIIALGLFIYTFQLKY